MTTTIIIGLLIPLLGTMLGFRLHDESRDVCAIAKVVIGLCLWSDGSSVRMVVAHSRYGDEG